MDKAGDDVYAVLVGDMTAPTRSAQLGDATGRGSLSLTIARALGSASIWLQPTVAADIDGGHNVDGGAEIGAALEGALPASL